MPTIAPPLSPVRDPVQLTQLTRDLLRTQELMAGVQRLGVVDGLLMESEVHTCPKCNGSACDKCGFGFVIECRAIGRVVPL